MNMLIDNHRIISERQQRAWSQSQLADASGLSLRTVQRIEKEGKASLESAKALAAVYNLVIPNLLAKRIVAEEPIATVHEGQANVELLTATAKAISCTVFILTTIVLVFSVWSKLPTVGWIITIRDAIFSSNLTTPIINAISFLMVVIISYFIALVSGGIYDALHNQGWHLHFKGALTANCHSISNLLTKIKGLVITKSKFLAKPMLISTAVLAFSGGVIYLDMEDYQKNNMARFVQQIFSE